MKLKPADKKIPLKAITHSLRASQAILQYGVGAMVDFPEQTLMTAAPEHWDNHATKIHDERLEKALNVSCFAMPGATEGMAFVRFPEWYFCPKCRKFQPITKWAHEYKRTKAKDYDPDMVNRLKCTRCNQELVVTRIVTICEHGHIDDFPWVKWVHAQNKPAAKPICKHPSLTFKTSASSSEGLEGLTITCESCHARSTLLGAFGEGALENIDEKTNHTYDFSCQGRHPWKHTKESCDCYPKVVQRGGSSVYFPIVSTSLVIPPYSSKLTKMIEENDNFTECKISITGAIDALKNLPLDPKQIETIRHKTIEEKIDKYASKIALSISVQEEQVREVLSRKWLTGEGEFYGTTSVRYKAEEYEALSGKVQLQSDLDDDFIREETNIEEYGLPFIKQISLIHKVKEVQALTGFSRLKPVEPPENPDKETNNFVSIKESDTDWYPAYQVRGEGIFIEFEEASINEWVENQPLVETRVNLLNENFRNSFMAQNRAKRITPKFLLLHTISHLLIKQLSFECGYSIASLKERIYCADEEDGVSMAGILIYTASGDSEGTLGGLVRQGRADTFPEIFKKAIESAMYCSNDPVCSLSQGQGRDSLNLSACYSCTLIPETSCEEFNVFLDRGVVTGTFDKKEIGFFYNQLYTENKWDNNKACVTEPQKLAKKNDMFLIVADNGIDLTDQSFDEIWNNLLEWTEDEGEINNILELIHFFSERQYAPKPRKDVELKMMPANKSVVCDLYWSGLKIAYFTADNFEDYDAMQSQSDLNCFIGNNMDVSELIKCFIEGE